MPQPESSFHGYGLSIGNFSLYSGNDRIGNCSNWIGLSLKKSHQNPSMYGNPETFRKKTEISSSYISSSSLSSIHIKQGKIDSILSISKVRKFKLESSKMGKHFKQIPPKLRLHVLSLGLKILVGSRKNEALEWHTFFHWVDHLLQRHWIARRRTYKSKTITVAGKRTTTLFPIPFRAFIPICSS